MRDFLASLIDQVIGGDHPDGFIVDADKIGGQAHEKAIDQDVGNLALFDAAKTFDRPLRRGDQHDVYAAGEQLFNLLPLQFRIFFRGSDDQAVALPADPGRNGLGNLRKEGMQQIGNDQPDGRGAAGNEGPRGQVGLVIAAPPCA